MEREEFIKSLGLGLALLCTGSCISGCGGKGDTGTPDPGPKPPGGGSTATIDLATQLMTIGDQIIANGVLFFRIAAGNSTASIVATESICPHQGGNLVWKGASSKIQCQLHFSEYSSNGAVIQGPQNTTGTTRTLKVYSTALSGTKLTATIV
ncbi:ubiquinol-cytochrome c reductase iron-sulfur subunit [Pedobacter nyackensis]|uniref:QcrA and Rieske domain-containing protein n=1 Tax=Pedobacter nyackensis TaxID=475255 RepID=UPI00292F79E9|nr:Rieske 2Fe-2S domain-containing protein [Pedobacter nyackensis]